MPRLTGKTRVISDSVMRQGQEGGCPIAYAEGRGGSFCIRAGPCWGKNSPEGNPKTKSPRREHPWRESGRQSRSERSRRSSGLERYSSGGYRHGCVKLTDRIICLNASGHRGKTKKITIKEYQEILLLETFRCMTMDQLLRIQEECQEAGAFSGTLGNPAKVYLSTITND